MSGIKTCGCGLSYSVTTWRILPFVGMLDDGDAIIGELRNCVCGSTICVALEDLEEAPPTLRTGTPSPAWLGIAILALAALSGCESSALADTSLAAGNEVVIASAHGCDVYRTIDPYGNAVYFSAARGPGDCGGLAVAPNRWPR